MNDIQEIGLIITNGPNVGTYHSIKSFPCTLGRKENNSISLANDFTISACHCEIDYRWGQLYINDLHSTNGTFVNGKKIFTPTQISVQKTTITIGNTEFIISTPKNIDRDESRTQALRNMISKGSIIIPNSSLFGEENEEILFVVDICDSTRIANQHGEKELFKIIYTISEIINIRISRENILFLKCTGDGFFATFSETKQSIYVGCMLLTELKNISSKSGKLINPGLRISIHKGKVSRGQNGDRFGLACHLAFRLENAKKEDRVEEDNCKYKLKNKNRILITEEALISLGSELKECFNYIGRFNFKGFNEPINVYMLITDENKVLERIKASETKNMYGNL